VKLTDQHVDVRAGLDQTMKVTERPDGITLLTCLKINPAMEAMLREVILRHEMHRSSISM